MCVNPFRLKLTTAGFEIEWVVFWILNDNHEITFTGHVSRKEVVKGNEMSTRNELFEIERVDSRRSVSCLRDAAHTVWPTPLTRRVRPEKLGGDSASTQGGHSFLNSSALDAWQNELLTMDKLWQDW